MATFTFHGDELEAIPADWPKRMPPGTRRLGGAEWAQSMMSTRMDEYRGWASKKLSRVFVWRQDPDVAEFAPVRFRPYASGPLTDDEITSMANCLRFAWEEERVGYQLKEPSTLRPGVLDEAVLSGVARLVWARTEGLDVTGADVPEQSLLLDQYDSGAGETKWCWKNTDTDEASQEFDSEEEALEAWRNNQLQWSRLEDLGN